MFLQYGVDFWCQGSFVGILLKLTCFCPRVSTSSDFPRVPFLSTVLSSFGLFSYSLAIQRAARVCLDFHLNKLFNRPWQLPRLISDV